MPIYHLFVLSRAGSLIYDFDNTYKTQEMEKTFSYPLDFKLEVVDQRITVAFGERDGIKVGHVILSVNGKPVNSNGKMEVTKTDGENQESQKEVDVLQYLRTESNFPLSISFGQPPLTTNEKIVLSSMFHSLHAIGAQLSPVPKSSGITQMDTDHFRLECFPTKTGIKFILVGDTLAQNMDQVLRRIYEFYADYALKNPFYSLDMPIRCDLFDQAVKSLIEKFDKAGGVINV